MGWSPCCTTTLWEKERSCKRNYHPVWSCTSTSSGSKQLEVQATDVKSVTELAIGPVMNMDLLEAKNSRNQNPLTKTPSSCKTTCKLSSSTQLEPHHRVVHQLPLSPDSGLSNETLYTDSAHAIHPQRVSNLSNIERKLEIKINFPSSNDKIWSKIDEDLKVAIPKVFTKQVFNILSTSELSKKFDTWLHQFFLTFWSKSNERKNYPPEKTQQSNGTPTTKEKAI